MKRIGRSMLLALTGLAIVGSSQAARANMEIQLGGATQVDVGHVIDVDVSFNANELVLGGGFQIDFDPSLLEVVSFTFNSRFPDERIYRCGLGVRDCVGVGGGHRVPIGFGRFDGMTGSQRIGVLRLRGIAPGTSSVDVVPYSRTGEFVDLVGDPVNTLSNSLGLTVVPEPGMALLIAAGVPGLAFLGRRRRA